MLKLSIIGNLGADAKVESSNGRSWVSFRVAHRESFKKSSGETVEKTVWVSCALNGDGHGVVPYLRCGREVYVYGDASFNIYSSPKTHQMECGVQISVRDIKLLGSKLENRPRSLIDADGVVHPTSVRLFVDTAGVELPCVMRDSYNTSYDIAQDSSFELENGKEVL